MAADIATATAPGPLFGPKDAIDDNTGRYVVTESMNIFDKIVCDHRKVSVLYDTYRSPSTTMEQKQLLGWELIMELSMHNAKEELVVYPVVRQALGDDAADHLIAEHQAAKNILATLDAMVVTDPLYDQTLRAAVESMLGHITEEEENFYPRLAGRLTPAAQLHLGILFAAAAVRAPTRPHPEATPVPPFNESLYAAAKLVDVTLDQARYPSLVTAVVAALSPAPAGDTDVGAGAGGGGAGAGVGGAGGMGGDIGGGGGGGGAGTGVGGAGGGAGTDVGGGDQGGDACPAVIGIIATEVTDAGGDDEGRDAGGRGGAGAGGDVDM